VTLQRASKIGLVSLALTAALACSKSGPGGPPQDGGDDADGGVPDGGDGVPPGPAFAVGARHNCAIFGGGAVRCWGDNSAGQLGRPPPFDPLAVYSVDLGPGWFDNMVVSGSQIFFTRSNGNGNELWVSDGTAAGTHLVKDINPGSDSSSPANEASWSCEPRWQAHLRRSTTSSGSPRTCSSSPEPSMGAFRCSASPCSFGRSSRRAGGR